MKTGRWVLMVLGVLTVGSLWRTASVEQDKQRLSQSYQQAQREVTELDRERVLLSSEVETARKTIKDQGQELTHLQTQLTSVQNRLDETVAELASLQREHERLRQHDASLVGQVSTLAAEKQQLEARLGSLTELRLAIREVKRQMHNERWAAWRARIEEFKRQDQAKLAAGNRGYLTRGGASTVGSAVRLRVHVLEPKSE